MTDKYFDFDEYIVASETLKRERAEEWKVAIGLQAKEGCRYWNNSVDAGQAPKDYRRTSTKRVNR